MARANAVLNVSSFEDYAKTGVIVYEVLGVGRIEFRPQNASEGNRAYAEYHGWKQRQSDCIVSCETAGDKFKSIKTLAEHYESGSPDWRIKTASGERDNTGLFYQAYCVVFTGNTPEGARAKVEALSAKKGIPVKTLVATMAKNPDIIRAIAELKASKSTAGNADDLLAELEG